MKGGRAVAHITVAHTEDVEKREKFSYFISMTSYDNIERQKMIWNYAKNKFE